MTDFFFPPAVVPSQTETVYIDAAARFQSPLAGTVRTVARPGERLRLTMGFQTLTGTARRQLKALVAAMRGDGRVYIPLHGLTAGGSFSAPELFTNNTFASGTTGWGTQQSSLSVADRVMRLKVLKDTSAGPTALSQVPTVTAYAPHAMRGFLGPRTKTGVQAGTFANSTSNYSTDAAGLITQAFVPTSTSAGTCYPAVYDANENVTFTGDWLDVPYTSLRRCAMVDGGGNLLLQSQDFTNASWVNFGSSDSANVATAPDGTTTADDIVEDGSTGNHGVQQTVTVSSAAADYVGAVSVRANGRTWCRVLLVEDTGSTSAWAYVNLSTGALGTTSAGANWANLRAYVVAQQQSGMFRIHLVARKANAATSLRLRIEAATADNNASYTGSGASAITLWGASLAASSLPVRYVATTTTAAAAASVTGSALYLKGLPASTDGLLLPGDFLEVGGELHEAATRLDSDAAGIGVLQLAKPLRSGKAADTPVIVGEPVGKFLLANPENALAHFAGGYSDASLEFIEDLA